MAPPDLSVRYAARLLADWLGQRFETKVDITEVEGEVLVADIDGHRAGLYVAPLWETSEAWAERLRSVEQRLDATGVRGPLLLWVPPGAEVPAEEPDLSDFTLRVQMAASSLLPGGRAEVTFPVTIKMGKMRDEGGYASVVGGLSRWWTRITENVDGTYHVDSAAVHRITQDGEARERLWQTIGQVSKGVELGQATEFEIEEAWTLQRLPEGEQDSGFALLGAPPGVDPADGILIRRSARRVLAAANEALDALDVELRAVGLIGGYEYVELEGIGATVKALTPDLFSRLQVVLVLADGDVRPTFLPRALPWAN